MYLDVPSPFILFGLVISGHVMCPVAKVLCTENKMRERKRERI